MNQHNRHNNRAIICFTRVPEAGATKTRLMPTLSGIQCERLQCAMLRDIAKACEDCDADLYVTYHIEACSQGGSDANQLTEACSQGGAETEEFAESRSQADTDASILREIFPQAKEFFPQKGADLGAKMHNAICHVLSLGYSSCILTGSDIPELTGSVIREAFIFLEDKDVVISPTVDGGYYLVGMKKPCEELFSGKTYSTGSVYEDALEALRGAGCSYAEGVELSDIDTPENLARLHERIRGNGSHTAEYLDEIGYAGGPFASPRAQS